MQKLIYASVFLPVIIFLGAITSYEDIRYGKIRNKWIIFGIAYCFFVYLLAYIFYNLAVKEFVSHVFGGISSYLLWGFSRWGINLIFSVIVGFMFWHYKIWAPGDGKLFICYAALIPVGQYIHVYFQYYFASFLLLLTFFIPATLFLLVKAILHFKRQEASLNFFKRKMIESFRSYWTQKDVWKISLGLMLIFLFLIILRVEFQNTLIRFLPNQNLVLILLFFIFKPLARLFRKHSITILCAGVLLLIYWIVKIKYGLGEKILALFWCFLTALLIVALLPLLKKIIAVYIEKTKERTIPFAPWMFLGVLIVWFF